MNTVAQPDFIPGHSGNLFILYFPPNRARDKHKGVLFFPPFAEELNKSRRMVALQARRCAELGYGVLLLDLYGTGDSSGDFGQAHWSQWRQDMLAGVTWLLDHGARKVDFWGLRTGALLALDVARELESADILDHILLWNPVLKGQVFVTQFLRLRMAADLANSAGGVDTQQLRAALQQGESVEVAGYDLAPELVLPMEALDLQVLPPRPGVRVDWFELAGENRPISPASAKLVEAWRATDVDVDIHQVVGDAFWSTPEITLAPDLLDATTQALGRV